MVLSYNGARWLPACLDSVLSTDYEDLEVTVVDNASTDGSPDLVRSRYPEVTLLRNRANLGFAAGNNVGLRHAIGRRVQFVVLLNQDMLVERGWLSSLLLAADSLPEGGVFSPYQLNYEGTDLDPNFQNLLAKSTPLYSGTPGIRSSTRAIGACVMLRCAALKRVGLFDPYFFCFAEDDDLCERVRYHGYQIYLVAASRVRHWHSAIRRDVMPKQIRDLFLRNLFVGVLKNHGRSLTSSILKYFTGDALRLSRKFGSLRDPAFVLRIARIQMEIAIHFPDIVVRRLLEQRGPRYL